MTKLLNGSAKVIWGILRRSGHYKVRIEKALFIRTIPERVFRALTEPSELEQWFVSAVQFKPATERQFRCRLEQRFYISGEKVGVTGPS